jgi:hypothetical protein
MPELQAGDRVVGVIRDYNPAKRFAWLIPDGLRSADHLFVLESEMVRAGIALGSAVGTRVSATVTPDRLGRRPRATRIELIDEPDQTANLQFDRSSGRRPVVHQPVRP